MVVLYGWQTKKDFIEILIRKEHKKKMFFKKNLSADKTVFRKKYFIRVKTLGLGPFNITTLLGKQ